MNKKPSGMPDGFLFYPRINLMSACSARLQASIGIIAGPKCSPEGERHNGIHKSKI
jgi:hypothetical protein